MTKDQLNNIISWRFTSNKLIDIIKHRRIVHIGLFLLIFISLTSVLAWKYFPSKNYQQGIVSTRDILAPRTFEVVNETATIRAQSQAINSIEPVYSKDPFIMNQVDSNLKSQFAIYNNLRIANRKNDQLKIKELKSQLPVSISDTSLHIFVNSDINSLHQMEVFTRDLVMQALQEGVKDDTEVLKKARANIRKSAESLNIQEQEKNAIADLASEAIQPNSKIDEKETDLLREQTRNSVKPIMNTIKKGQVIVSKGQIITPEHIRILESMGLQRNQMNIGGFTGIAIFTLIFIIISWYFLKLSAPEVANKPIILLLLIIIVISNISLCTLLIQFNPYWAPIPIASILIAILIHPGVSFLLTAFMAIIIGLLTGEFQFIVVPLVTGIASVMSVWRVRRRMDLVTASLIVFSVNVLSVIFITLLTGDENSKNFIENLVFAGINGFSSGIVAVGLLPLLEHSFNFTTSIKLLELSNQSEPLLKRLLLEAPGTYHHSIIVGNLAEAGAEAVGEDPLLCRVASYYHDIGKLKRPYFFIENQLGSENPHDKLSPNLSALIILAHTKDGLELGKQHQLPKPILDIIVQHHSNSITAFFYHRATQENKEPPSEDDFRYPGPKPQTKAAAIVMLADSTEAAARTIQNPTPQKIENLVKSIIKKAVDEGHLDECPLSLKNINDLTNTFTTILTGIYHHRIEYPEQIMEQIGLPSVIPASPISKVTFFNREAK
jgi:putative nucleotidyltransferase with HDIG domain